MSFQVVQISDCHLFSDAQTRLKGVPTMDTFHRVMSVIHQEFPDADRYIFTGDLTHDENVVTYHQVRDSLGEWFSRCRFLPGNHDIPDIMCEAFPELTRLDSGSISFAETLEDWCLIGLDSHVPGETYGRVGDRQLAWLSEQLERYRDMQVMVFLHHPPFDVGSAWLDRIGLRNQVEFRKLLQTHRQVRVIFVGHIHQVFEGKADSIDLLSVPSTGVQFVPHLDHCELDPIPAGFRVTEFSGFEFQSQVVRLPDLGYTPE